jgi:formylglycine-generating enzyme required for sulfatase activity
MAGGERSLAWQISVKDALAGPVADERLRLSFDIAGTLAELHDRLESGAYDVIHVVGRIGSLTAGDGSDKELSTSGAFELLSAAQLERENLQAVTLRCVLLTHDGTDSRPIANVPLSIVAPGTLERGGALEFSRSFYAALAAGLDVEAAFNEGVMGAFERDAQAFEPILFKDGKRAVAKRSPYDELRDLKEVARTISARIVAIQNQLSLSSSLGVGDLLAGRFVLQELASSGGFTEVWKAYDRTTQTLVAVKILHDTWTRNRYRITQFEQAALGMAQLHGSAGIAEVISPVEREQERRFFVMRWYAGGDLRRAVVERGLDSDAALTACLDVIDGLARAHKRHVLHRDIKPGHVLLDERNRGYLCDFDVDPDNTDDPGTLRGVAAAPFAAPELRPRLDVRADIYSMAVCVLYVLAGGPFGPDPLHYVEQVENCTPALEQALRDALARDREQRTTTLEKLGEVIRDFVTTPKSKRHRSVAGWAEQGTDRYGRWATIVIKGVQQRMRWIERGRFSMGSDHAADMSAYTSGWRQPSPVHSVTLSQGFWMAETECTQALWEAVMDSNPSEFLGPERPVETVSWNDVQRFFVALNEIVGGPKFKLPTEAQWEYACRADTTTMTYAGVHHSLDEIAWYAANSKQTSLVGQKACNAWGLYDTLGNVWEWCDDPPRVYHLGAVVDPVGSYDQDERVLRGGGWYSSAQFGVRAIDRMAERRAIRDARVGFRIARAPA